MLLLALSPTNLVAADWKPLRGIYAITAGRYLDPAEGEAPDSHVRFQLEADVARELFAAMKVAVEQDACTGALAKQIGGMRCLHYTAEDRYACDFSIDIARQSIVYGVAC